MNVYWRRELRVKKTRRKQILTMTAAPAGSLFLPLSLLPSCPPPPLFIFSLKCSLLTLIFLLQRMSYVNNLTEIDNRKCKSIPPHSVKKHFLFNKGFWSFCYNVSQIAFHSQLLLLLQRSWIREHSTHHVHRDSALELKLKVLRECDSF